MPVSKTDVLLDLQRGVASSLSPDELDAFARSVLQTYVQEKMTRGKTPLQARDKLDELEQTVKGSGLPEFQLLFIQVRDQLVPSGSPLPTEVSPYWYISRRGSNSGVQLISSRGGDASPDRAALTIADKQASVLAALKNVNNELEAYRIIFVYAQRKVLAGKDTYMTGYKLEQLERDVKDDGGYTTFDLAPIFIAVRRELQLPPSPIFKSWGSSTPFIPPPPLPSTSSQSYDAPPSTTDLRAPSVLTVGSQEPPPPYYAT